MKMRVSVTGPKSQSHGSNSGGMRGLQRGLSPLKVRVQRRNKQRRGKCEPRHWIFLTSAWAWTVLSAYPSPKKENPNLLKSMKRMGRWEEREIEGRMASEGATGRD